MNGKGENKKRSVKAYSVEFSLVPLRFKLVVIFD
jgi:hypothetical protein